MLLLSRLWMMSLTIPMRSEVMMKGSRAIWARKSFLYEVVYKGRSRIVQSTFDFGFTTFIPLASHQTANRKFAHARREERLQSCCMNSELWRRAALLISEFFFYCGKKSSFMFRWWWAKNVELLPLKSGVARWCGFEPGYSSYLRQRALLREKSTVRISNDTAEVEKPISAGGINAIRSDVGSHGL